MTNRYNNYKNSEIEWVDVIPSHWNSKNIKYLTKDIKTGKTPSTKVEGYFENGIINWFRPSDISNSFNLEKSKKMISELAVKDNQVNILSKNAVLMNTIGAVGNVSYVSEDHSTNQQITHIKFIDSNKYYSYLLKSLKSFVFCLANTTTLPQLNNDRLKYLYLINPPLKEQKAIANYLNNKTKTIDYSIESLKKQKDLLIEEKKAIIYKAVTKGLDDTVPMKDSGIEWIEEMPQNWKINKFKNIIKPISSGISSFEGKKNYLTTKSINEFGINKIDSKITFNERPSRANMEPVLNSIWIAYMKDTNKMLLIDDIDIVNNYIISTGMFGFLPKKNVNSKFLSYLIKGNNFISQKHMLATGTTQVSVNDSDFKNIYISIPLKLKEQKEIVKYLDKKTSKIDEAVKEIEKQIDLLEEYKKVLINDVVTGKKKVYDGEI